MNCNQTNSRKYFGGGCKHRKKSRHSECSLTTSRSQGNLVWATVHSQLFSGWLMVMEVLFLTWLRLMGGIVLDSVTVDGRHCSSLGYGWWEAYEPTIYTLGSNSQLTPPTNRRTNISPKMLYALKKLMFDFWRKFELSVRNSVNGVSQVWRQDTQNGPKIFPLKYKVELYPFRHGPFMGFLYEKYSNIV